MTEKVENFITDRPVPDEPGQEINLVRAAAEPGMPCPKCTLGVMDYDGLLNLVCPVCHYTQGGCFT